MPTRRTSPFLTPIKKLVAFFQRSRDQWKAKCKAAKRQNKSLRICLAKMKESRDRWKAVARSREEPKNAPPCGRGRRREGTLGSAAGGLRR